MGQNVLAVDIWLDILNVESVISIRNGNASDVPRWRKSILAPGWLTAAPIGGNDVVSAVSWLGNVRKIGKYPYKTI
jgi:hypothetical protein